MSDLGGSGSPAAPIFLAMLMTSSFRSSCSDRHQAVQHLMYAVNIHLAQHAQRLVPAAGMQRALPDRRAAWKGGRGKGDTGFRAEVHVPKSSAHRGGLGRVLSKRVGVTVALCQADICAAIREQHHHDPPTVPLQRRRNIASDTCLEPSQFSPFQPIQPMPQCRCRHWRGRQ